MMKASLLSLSSHAHQQIIRDTFPGNQVHAVVKVKNSSIDQLTPPAPLQKHSIPGSASATQAKYSTPSWSLHYLNPCVLQPTLLPDQPKLFASALIYIQVLFAHFYRTRFITLFHYIKPQHTLYHARHSGYRYSCADRSCCRRPSA